MELRYEEYRYWRTVHVHARIEKQIMLDMKFAKEDLLWEINHHSIKGFFRTLVHWLRIINSRIGDLMLAKKALKDAHKRYIREC